MRNDICLHWIKLRKPSMTIAGIPAEIRTLYLPNTKRCVRMIWNVSTSPGQRACCSLLVDCTKFSYTGEVGGTGVIGEKQWTCVVFERKRFKTVNSVAIRTTLREFTMLLPSSLPLYHKLIITPFGSVSRQRTVVAFGTESNWYRVPNSLQGKWYL